MIDEERKKASKLITNWLMTADDDNEDMKDMPLARGIKATWMRKTLRNSKQMDTMGYILDNNSK